MRRLREEVALHAEDGLRVQGCCLGQLQHTLHVAAAAAADTKTIDLQARQPLLVERCENVPKPKCYTLFEVLSHSSTHMRALSVCACEGTGTTLKRVKFVGEVLRLASPAVDHGGSGTRKR